MHAPGTMCWEAYLGLFPNEGGYVLPHTWLPIPLPSSSLQLPHSGLWALCLCVPLWDSCDPLNSAPCSESTCFCTHHLYPTTRCSRQIITVLLKMRPNWSVMMPFVRVYCWPNNLPFFKFSLAKRKRRKFEPFFSLHSLVSAKQLTAIRKGGGERTFQNAMLILWNTGSIVCWHLLWK